MTEPVEYGHRMYTQNIWFTTIVQQFYSLNMYLNRNIYRVTQGLCVCARLCMEV